MTAGAEEHEPLISSSVDNQRVSYNNSPPVSPLCFKLKSILKYIQCNYKQKLKDIGLELTTKSRTGSNTLYNYFLDNTNVAFYFTFLL